jgi:hypothetical protein
MAIAAYRKPDAADGADGAVPKAPIVAPVYKPAIPAVPVVQAKPAAQIVTAQTTHDGSAKAMDEDEESS